MDYKLTSIHVVQDTTIRLRFDGGGWAFMTFQQNPDKNWCNVCISSDWDDWSYSWTTSGMGEDIYSFMSRDRRDLGYFVNKFTGGQRDFLYFEETIAELKKHLEKEYADHYLLESVLENIDEMEDTDNCQIFYLSLPSDLNRIIDDSYEIVNCIQTGLSPRHKYFFDKIFPLFIPEIEKLKTIEIQLAVID